MLLNHCVMTVFSLKKRMNEWIIMRSQFWRNNTNYNLRPRLPCPTTKKISLYVNNSLFIVRMLYKDSYWLCVFSSFYLLYSCWFLDEYMEYVEGNTVRMSITLWIWSTEQRVITGSKRSQSATRSANATQRPQGVANHRLRGNAGVNFLWEKFEL